MRFLLLGPLQLAGDASITINAPKVETLLATLLVRANQVVPADELISELWGEHPPRRVRAAIHVYVSQIRKILGQDPDGSAVLQTRSQGYQLMTDPAVIDVTDLRTLYVHGLGLESDDPAAALAVFTRATALFRGPILGGIRNGIIVGGFGRWADELRLECLEAIARCSLAAGRHRDLISELGRWAEEYPLHEAFHEQLMLALHRSGRRAEALAVFQLARRALREELGLEPRDSMRRLQTAILNDRVLSPAG
jgi:DNA-binding SARP family transcriptional activator